jgi:hypothetical protein
MLLLRLDEGRCEEEGEEEVKPVSFSTQFSVPNPPA